MTDMSTFLDGTECPADRLKAFKSYVKRWGFEPPHLLGLEIFFHEVLEDFMKHPIYLNGDRAKPQDRNELGAFRAYFQIHNERPQSKALLLAWALANRPKEKGE